MIITATELNGTAKGRTNEIHNKPKVSQITNSYG